SAGSAGFSLQGTHDDCVILSASEASRLCCHAEQGEASACSDIRRFFADAQNDKGALTCATTNTAPDKLS
ncbi:MAG: hypothetical protein RMM08_11465, partial [Armatimonadota bacterium]|nr:hypothetical protein [Armatimonadota bacterium]